MTATSPTMLQADTGLTGEEKKIREWAGKVRGWCRKWTAKKHKASETLPLSPTTPITWSIGGRRCWPIFNPLALTESDRSNLNWTLPTGLPPRSEDAYPEPAPTTIANSAPRPQTPIFSSNETLEWAPEHASFASGHSPSRSASRATTIHQGPVPSRASSSRYPPLSLRGPTVPDVRTRSFSNSLRNRTLSMNSMLDAYARGYEEGRTTAACEQTDSQLLSQSAQGAGSPGALTTRDSVNGKGVMTAPKERTLARLMEDKVAEKRGFKMGWEKANEALRKEGWTKGCVHCSQQLREGVLMRRANERGRDGGSTYVNAKQRYRVI